MGNFESISGNIPDFINFFKGKNLNDIKDEHKAV